MKNQIVAFNGQNLSIINQNHQQYFSSQDVAKALGYARSDKITQIYNRHADEFSADMSETLKLRLSGNLSTTIRVFSLRGCHLLAMFSKTPVAKEFRRWVLDLIEQHNQALSKMNTVEVQSHTRSLPSGKKEIVLSEKAKTEIGGIVKACTASVLKEVFSGLNKTEPVKLNLPKGKEVDEKLLKLSEAAFDYGRSQYQNGKIDGILTGMFSSDFQELKKRAG